MSTDGDSERGVARVSLGYVPREWQTKARKQFKRFTVLVVNRGAGKTILACATLLDSALRTERNEARYAYVAPLRVQAKSIAWDILRGWVRLIPGAEINETELRLDLPNGSRISVYGADNPDSLRGLHHDGLVLDEVAQMRPVVWGEILRPGITARKGWVLFIGTPKGTNLFSELYFHALENPDEWFAGLWTVHDTKCLSDEEIESARRTMSENQFRQEFLLDWNASVDNQLITLDQVLNATKRSSTPDIYERHPKIMGVDVARYGGDQSVIARRQGPMLFPLRYMTNYNNMEVAAEVAKAWNEWGADACFIDNGRGEGVIDRLRQLGFKPMGIDFGGTKLIRQGYLRHRDMMWGDMAEWTRTIGCLPNDEKLRAALCAPQYSHDNPHNLMQLESKDDVRERLMFSPDAGDALGLTFAVTVALPVGREAEHLRPRMASKTVFDDLGLP